MSVRSFLAFLRNSSIFFSFSWGKSLVRRSSTSFCLGGKKAAFLTSCSILDSVISVNYTMLESRQQGADSSRSWHSGFL